MLYSLLMKIFAFFFIIFMSFIQANAQVVFNEVNKPIDKVPPHKFVKTNNGNLYANYDVFTDTILNNSVFLENSEWKKLKNSVYSFGDTLVSSYHNLTNDSIIYEYTFDNFVNTNIYKIAINQNDSIFRFKELFEANNRILTLSHYYWWVFGGFNKDNILKIDNVGEYSVLTNVNREIDRYQYYNYGINLLFSSYDDNIILLSTNNGENWRVDSLYIPGITNPDNATISVVGMTNNHIYFNVYLDLFNDLFHYRRGINDNNWEFIGNDLKFNISQNNDYYKYIKFIKQFNNNYYAATGLGVFHSIDGLNWDLVGNIINAVPLDIINYSDSLILTTHDGLLIKRPNETTWNDFSNGLPALIRTFGVLSSKNIITLNGNVSFNNGNNWHNLKKLLISNGTLSSNITIGVNNINLYIGSEDTLYIFNNSGLLSKTKSTGLFNDSYLFSSNIIECNNNLFVYQGSNLLKKSTNNGATWFNANTGITNTSASGKKLLKDGNTIYMYNNRFLYQSTNEGISWQMLKSITVNQNPYKHFAVENNLMAIYREGLDSFEYSTDGGTTWYSSNACTNYNKYITCMPQVIIRGIPIVINGSELRYSLDSMQTWRSLSTNLVIDNQMFNKAEYNYNFFVYNQDTTLYLACDSGLFRAEIDIRMLDTAGVVASVKQNENEKQNESREQLKLYPNPTTGSLQVAVSSGEIVEVRVYNIVGSLQYSVSNNQSAVGNRQLAINNQQSQVSSLQSNISTLDISSLPQGMYIIQVKTNKGEVLRGKVMKN
jgi:hypothetical protein